MTIFDTSGSTSIPGWGGKLTAYRGGSYSLVHTGPTNGNAIPRLTATVTVTISHDIGWLADVDFQASRDQTFATVDWSVLKTEQPDGQVTALITGMIDEHTYYWRARIKESGAQGIWTGWSNPWSIIVDTGSGRAFSYNEQNIGTSISMQSAWTLYSDWNVGWEPHPDHSAISYNEENVAVIYLIKSPAVEYVEEGDVNTDTPTPHLWFLKPPSGRPGEGIRIFGLGMGDLQSTYDGVVEINYGGENWTPVQLLSWQTFPPSANAYTELRKLDEETEYIDMQHTVVEISVPDDAMPPGYPIRIKTDGP